ncbi:gamma-butyrobetaine dioxygenase-like isoform X2 [Patiria miniata]|uniref:Gamma-butyrobetaine dioxygenase n=1 Tax=Patiria miniata TaxID=46514 RepID=A0A913ZMK5_PATMI|nr:gamma-butyrobetaine dioxygenase-like isoform X2 [Patiria miniata]
MAANGEAQPRLLKVTRDDQAKWYVADLSDYYSGKYPYVWLRDNCQCSQCYNKECLQRETLTADMDPEVLPASESVVDDGRALEVVWPDQHRSSYRADWLDCQRFSESQIDPISHPEYQVWGAEMNGNIPTFDYASILSTDKVLYEWLRVLQTTGIALVQRAPKEKGVCRQLAERVAFFRRTIYGEEWQVESKPNVSSLGYTSKYLVLHTDLPYYISPPEVQLLHCIEQAKGKGGENQFVDGWNIVRQLKAEHPEAYKLLSGVPIDYKNAATDQYPFHMKASRPIIDYDLRGELCMRYNDPIRAPYMLMPVEKVTEMYKAIKLFNQVIYRPQNLVHHRLTEGEMVTFNNRRLLHGRSSFEVQAGSSRLLEGGYIDWDEVRSRTRVLREKLYGIKRL